ncbi:MAG: M56 family metallopeptidase [bacterium]
MSAAWIVFVLITGRVLTMAGQFGERLAAGAGKPRRFVWLATLLTTALWPAVSLAVLNLSQAALDLGWGFGTPRYIPVIVLRMPNAHVAAWLDSSLLMLWALVSAVLLARLAVFAYATARWRQGLATAEMEGVRVRLSRDAGPAVVGVRAMDVVIPTWVLGLDPSMQQLILRHETEHRDARDIHLLWFAAVLTALMPWNPLLWWQAGRLRLAIEMDCDTRVLRDHPHPAEYARLLLHIAQHASDGRVMSRLAPALNGDTTKLEYRLAAMSQREPASTVLSRAACVVAIAHIVVLALCIQAPDGNRPRPEFSSGRFVRMIVPVSRDR